jgi:putative transposase
MGRHPFAIDAIVILPEHLHDIWMLPVGDADYSTRWRLIKTMFSRQCNPVRHVLVKARKDWEYSSFHRYVQKGKYDVMWGTGSSLQGEKGFE